MVNGYKTKKTTINSEKWTQWCFKWLIIAALYFTKIAKNPQTISIGKRLNFLLSRKIGEKLKKINPDFTIVCFVDDVDEVK